MGKLGLLILVSFAGLSFALLSGATASKALAAQKSGDNRDSKDTTGCIAGQKIGHPKLTSIR